MENSTSSPRPDEPMITLPASYLEQIEARHDKTVRMQTVAILVMFLLFLSYMIAHDLLLRDRSNVTTVYIDAVSEGEGDVNVNNAVSKPAEQE